MSSALLKEGYYLEVVERPAGNRMVIVSHPKYEGLLEPPAPEARKGEVAWYVPYTFLHPLAVESAPRDAIWVGVNSSVDAYYGAMLDLWDRGETFAVMEHDIICRPDVVKAFEECPEPWCVFGYSNICHVECMEAWRNALGCTRFRKEIIEAVPDAMRSIPRDSWHWTYMCDGLGNNLRAAGFKHHWHYPWVDHHPWA